MKLITKNLKDIKKLLEKPTFTQIMTTKPSRNSTKMGIGRSGRHHLASASGDGSVSDNLAMSPTPFRASHETSTILGCSRPRRNSAGSIR